MINVVERSSERRRYSIRPLILLSLCCIISIFWASERAEVLAGLHSGYPIGIILLSIYLYFFIRDRPQVIFTSFFQLFYYLGMLVSALFVSSGLEMIEIKQVGSANGVFWLMLLFVLIGIEATNAGYYFASLVSLPFPSKKFNIKTEWIIGSVLVIPCLLIALYVFVLTGGPLLSGVDRVTFWRHVAPAGTGILPSLVTQSFSFVICYYFVSLKSGNGVLLSKLTLLAYIIIGLFVLGQKFSLFVLFLNFFLIAFIGFVPFFKIRIKHVFLSGVIFCMLLTSVAVSYFLDGKGISFIAVRAALQSQLLWSLVQDSSSFGNLPNDISCFWGCSWFVNGQDYISYKYLPSGLYNFYKDGGTRLSGFFPALQILISGFMFTAIGHIFICFSCGFLQKKIVNALRGRKIVYGFLLFKVHFAINLIWLDAYIDPVRGLIMALIAIVVYRFLSVQHS